MPAYQSFAALYDGLMDDYDYDAWQAHYARLLHVQPGMRVAEIGCGTGEMIVRFAKQGYVMTGCDLSPDMIAVAKEKARSWGVCPTLAVQDMTRTELGRRVDAIFCACDGIGYLDSLQKVERCFVRVLENLKPGGAFAFDVTSPDVLLAMDGQMFGEDREQVSYIWFNQLDKKTRSIRMSLTFFAREDSGLYKKFSEEHVQRAHSVEELTTLLAKAGFENVRVTGGMGDEPPRAGDARIHFAARKPQG